MQDENRENISSGGNADGSDADFGGRRGCGRNGYGLCGDGEGREEHGREEDSEDREGYGCKEDGEGREGYGCKEDGSFRNKAVRQEDWEELFEEGSEEFFAEGGQEGFLCFGLSGHSEGLPERDELF